MEELKKENRKNYLIHANIRKHKEEIELNKKEITNFTISKNKLIRIRKPTVYNIKRALKKRNTGAVILFDYILSNYKTDESRWFQWTLSDEPFAKIIYKAAEILMDVVLIWNSEDSYLSSRIVDEIYTERNDMWIHVTKNIIGHIVNKRNALEVSKRECDE